jgi:hypothetical protein
MKMTILIIIKVLRPGQAFDNNFKELSAQEVAPLA